jgi:hypothetical protein
MKIKSILIMAVLSIAIVSASAQETHLIVNSEVRLPKDSIESAQLVSTLNNFLIATQQPNEDNKWILPSERLGTYILLDEFKDITKTQKDDNFFKPYLTNVVSIDKEHYHIQLAYMGVKENEPYLRASFELIAHKQENSFLFSSPLAQNTKDWKTLTFGNVTFHYQNQVYQKMSEDFAKQIAMFDTKLQINKPSEYYFCDEYEDMSQLLQLIGIQYKADYNGCSWDVVEFVADGISINFYHKALLLREQLDPHDLFHARAALAIPEDKRNNSMVCGCAYIYGGSWGISYDEIWRTFKSKLTNDKKTDWLKLYNERYNFGESQEKHLLVTQMINALIIQKVEKEKGFSAVMDLLGSGNFLKEKDNFFNILEKTTGINEKNFNKEVWKLINEEK